MTKIICILFFQFLLFNIYAQESKIINSSPKFQLKIGSGAAFPVSVKKAGFDAAYCPGFHFLIGKSLNVKSEIFSGFNLNGIGVRKAAPYIKYESYYASVPLMFKYEITSNFSLETGLQQCIPFFSRFSKLNGENASGRESNINKSIAKQLTFVNTGFSIKMNDQISIRTWYGIPLTPNQNFSFKLDTSSYNYSFRNNQIQFLITYTIPQFDKPKNEREISKILINDLKNGALLVMLPSKSILQEELIKKGKVEESDEIDQKLKEYYKSLISISKTKYNFSSIQFFMSEKIEQIKNHNYSDCFLDENLEINKQLNLPNDTKTMIAHISINENSVNNFNKKTGNGIFADYILIKDAEDYRVSLPFPYEIFVDVSNVNTLNYSNVLIEKLNKTLTNFYLKKNR